MISLGIIGYYIARIYEEIKGRPRYIVADRVKGGEHHEAASDKTV
jgi:dolichol-phosphate mannosyltransferase